MIIHDRIGNPLRGRYYAEYPDIEKANIYAEIRYADVGDSTTEQIHLRQTLDATRTTRVITSDTQARYKPRGYVLLADGLYQISVINRTIINPRAMKKRYRCGMSLTAVENPLDLKL